MLALDWWWALLLLPVPLVARRFLPPAQASGIALSVPLMQREHLTSRQAANRSQRMARACLAIFWICLVLAASRPFWLGEPVSRSVSGRDLMLAVDISGSMQEADMQIDSRAASRLAVLKQVIGQFIEQREGDRIGLILFGTHAYNYVPLTYDLGSLKKLLEDISTGLAGRYTAIGDAIGLAVKSVRQQDSQHKLLILVTDGSNTAGLNAPMLAARIASEEGLTIHTIGVGTDIHALSQEYGLQSIPPGTALNEDLLRKIAIATGGRYYRATSGQTLEQIYAELNQLEPVEREYQSYRPRADLFYLPLALALLALSLHLLTMIPWSKPKEVGW